MDTSIDNLIKSISDSVKKKDEEIKNLETDLEICEDRIKKLKEEIKKLQADEPVDDYVKAAYNDGYGAAMGKMIAFLNKIKSEPTVDTEARQKSYQYDFQKTLDKNPGRCYFCVNNDDLLDRKLLIVFTLSKTYKVSQTSVAKYLDKFVKNKERKGYTTILSNVSEDICRTLENHLKGTGIGYSWDFV